MMIVEEWRERGKEEEEEEEDEGIKKYTFLKHD